MKRVKTLLSIFLCIMACALFGACSCSGTKISVVAIAIAEVSDNLVKEEGTDRYLVRKGEKFTITYEIKPENASELTTYIEITPANKISTDFSIVRSNNAKNTVEFKASSLNIGESLITFQAKDGDDTVTIMVEIIDDNRVFSKPENLKYGYNSETGLNEFTWDKSTAETENGLLYASKYAIFINDERIETETNSYPIELQSGKDYFVRVQALGELKTRTSDGEISEDERFYVASTPKNLQANRGQLTWEYEDEDNINKFILDFDTYKVELDKDLRAFNLAQYIKQQDITGLGNFNVKLTAVNTDYSNGAPNDGNIMTYIMNSRNNPTLSLTQLYSPTNLRIENRIQPGDNYSSSMLIWDSVTNASSYKLSITKNGQDYGQLTIGQNGINLSKSEFVQDAILSKSSGEYTIKVTPQGDERRTFIQNDDFASLDFVITPFLYGNVNYTTDKLNLLTADLLTMLDLTTDDLEDKLTYEVYYSENITGYYDNVTVINSPHTDITLSSIIDISGSYNILVRPVPKSAYTTKNVVLPMLDEIQFNKTTSSMVTQLKGVSISSVDASGILSGIDENNTSNVEKYKFVLTMPSGNTSQELYSDNANLIFDENNFTVSLVDLFNIKDAGNYTIQIIPMSSNKVDGNPHSCNSFAFKQLASVDTSTINIDNNVITWDNVANYSSYTIKINNEEPVIVNANLYTIEDNSILIDNNTITIIVNGNGTNTISSSAVSVVKTRASVVSGFRVVDGILTWDDSVASTYYITITYPEGNVENIEVTTNEYSGLDKIATSADITISRGVSSSFNSEESEVITLNRLSVPTNDLAIINHSNIAQFSLVENADSYKITIKKASVVIDEYLISTDGASPTATIIDDEKIQFEISTLEAGNYSIFIQAIPNDQDSTDYASNNAFYLISDLSQNNDFVVYPQIGISNKTHSLNWSFASDYNVKEYTISFVNSEYENVVLTNTSFVFGETYSSGEYDLSLSVSSNVDNVIYSDPTLVTIVKTSTPTIAYNDGKVEFELVETASEYKAYNGDDTMLTNGVDYEITVVENKAFITPLNLQENVEYSIYIVAIGATDVIDGNKSNVVQFSIINSISGITMTTSAGKKVFTWEDVDGNDGYFITLSQGADTLETYTSSTNSYTIPDKYFSGEDKFVAGDYSISVVVLSDTLVNSNPVSATFTKLGVISNTDLNDNVISFRYEGSGTPVAYKLNVLTYESDVWSVVKTTTITHVVDVVPTYNLDELSAFNDYRIEIIVVGSDANMTLDGEAEKFTFKYGETNENTGEIFTKIDAPTFSYNNGKLQIIGTLEAESYEIYSVSDGVYTKLTYEYTLDSDLYVDLTSSNETYKIVAVAVAKDVIGKLNSVYSEEIQINKLVGVSDLSVNNNGLIHWTTNENAVGYTIYNLTTGQNLYLDGQATNSVTYEYLYTEFELDLGSSNEFCLRVMGSTKGGISYLNSTNSNSVTINAVNQISTIYSNDGQLTWDDISGVSSYRLSVENTAGNEIKSFVVNTNTYNINNLSDISNGMDVVVKVIPYSTTGNDYVIADSVNATSIKLKRYNVINAISIEKGLIKFKLNISGVDTNDLQEIINASDYSTLSEEIQQKYYGYYNFKINVDGRNINITLKDMDYTVNMVDILSGVFYATYQLNYDVQTTTLLNLNISSIGNSASSAVEYGAICSIPNTSNKTILAVYKHPAPIPTATSNLVSENGILDFKKIIGVDKYILTATSVGKDPNEELTYIIDTTLSGASTNYTIGNVSTIQFATSSGGTKLVDGDIEYVYTLTTLGTESGNSGELYLRSNSYVTTSIIFLSKPEISYFYNNGDTNGGFVKWGENRQALKYKLYALKKSDAQSSYPSNMDTVKANTSWIDNEKVYTCEIPNNQLYYMFENGGFCRGEGIDEEIDISLDSGSYWLTVQAIGDNTNFITPAGCNNTIEVYKVNPIINQKLENGTFYWEVQDSDESGNYVAGFRISVKIYSDGSEQVIELPTLTSISAGNNGVYSYTLDEMVTDAGSQTYTLNGYSASGSPETYGISIVAIGGYVNNNGNFTQCVNSIAENIDNSGAGYQRLDASVLSVVDGDLNWTLASQSVSNIMNYTLFVNGVETSNRFNNITNTFSFNNSLFISAGDYSLQIKVMAQSNNYLSSVKSEPLTAVKFYAPNLTTQDGVLVWENSGNGATHQPLSSTLKISSSDGVNSIEEVYSNTMSEFTFALEGDAQFPTGYYNVAVNYDGYYDETNNVYYIASNQVELTTYKLATIVIEDVRNFDDKEFPQFDSCIKWPIVKDQYGNNITKYQIIVRVFDGVEFKIDSSLSKTIPNMENDVYNIIKVEKDGELVDYPLFSFNKDGNGYVYYNISYMGDNENIKDKVQITVIALGTTSHDPVRYELNSSQSIKEIDYTDTPPDTSSSDGVNGIIRWTGKENNPVYITLQYGEVGSLTTENIYLDEEYISKYGNVYYLPYMQRYELVELRYILASCYLGSSTRVSVSTQSHFASGDGSMGNPYVINNASQLQNIQYRPLSHIKISESITTITLSGGWNIINEFGGVLDGNGVVIENISLTSKLQSGTTYASLFNTLLEGAVVKNLTLKYATSVGRSGSPITSDIYLGGIAISNSGTINNVTLSGTMNTYNQKSLYFGGFSVYNYGSITNSSVGIELTTSGVPLNSSSDAGLYGGGATFTNEGIIDFVSSTCTIDMSSGSMTSKRAGGFVIYNRGIILNSEFTGTLKAFDMVGIAVQNDYTAKNYTVSKKYSGDQNDTVFDYSGGSILGCYSTGNFVLASGKASQNIYVAGIVGINRSGNIGRCYAIIKSANIDFSTVRTNQRYVYVGGLVAYNSFKAVNDVYVAPLIENSYAISTTTFTDNSNYIKAGVVVGDYATETNGFSYTNYGLSKIYYCSVKSAFGATITISDENVLKAFERESDIINNSYKNNINEVSDADKYAHVREFYLTDDGMLLKLNKTI